MGKGVGGGHHSTKCADTEGRLSLKHPDFYGHLYLALWDLSSSASGTSISSFSSSFQEQFGHMLLPPHLGTPGFTTVQCIKNVLVQNEKDSHFILLSCKIINISITIFDYNNKTRRREQVYCFIVLKQQQLLYNIPKKGYLTKICC